VLRLDELITFWVGCCSPDAYRTIEKILKRSGLDKTAVSCFEKLRSGHINLIHSDLVPRPAYVVTEPNQEQRAILRSLRMKSLIDPEEIASQIKPR